jgi:hypothetical protein
MVREGERWVKKSRDLYNPALDEPAIDESTPLGQNEKAAFGVLQAMGAAQIDHWDKSSPPTYASAFVQLLASFSSTFFIGVCLRSLVVGLRLWTQDQSSRLAGDAARRKPKTPFRFLAGLPKRQVGRRFTGEPNQPPPFT